MAMIRSAGSAPMMSGGPSEPRPQGPFGQGKRAVTILGDQGDHVTVITDVPYHVRSRHLPSLSQAKGTRHMHRTTLAIPTSNTTDYGTTYKVHITAGRALRPTEVSRPCASQHTTQFSFRHTGEEARGPWDTNYTDNYKQKGSQLASQIHEASRVNRSQMMTGKSMHDVLATRDPLPNYWSQYNCVHSKLGVLLGSGVQRQRPVRRQFNVLTGEDSGAAWKEDNKRISGNRVLYNDMGRKIESRRFILG